MKEYFFCTKHSKFTYQVLRKGKKCCICKSHRLSRIYGCSQPAFKAKLFVSFVQLECPPHYLWQCNEDVVDHHNNDDNSKSCWPECVLQKRAHSGACSRGHLGSSAGSQAGSHRVYQLRVSTVQTQLYTFQTLTDLKIPMLPSHGTAPELINLTALNQLGSLHPWNLQFR